MAEQILVPDVGEAEDIEVIEVLVAVGDEVALDDSLVVLESDKASMEIPTPHAGTVVKLHVKEGDKVEEGKLIAEIETGSASAATNAPAQEVPKSESVEPEVVKSEPAEAAQESEVIEQIITVPDVGEAADITVTEILVQVGDDILIDDSLVVLESDKASMEIPSTHGGQVLEILVKDGDEVNEGDPLVKIAAQSVGQAPSPDVLAESVAAKTSGVEPREPTIQDAPPPALPAAEQAALKTASGAKIHAGPAVRKQAREYGVELTEIKGTGRQGRILKEDIQDYVKQRLSQPASTGTASGSGIPAVPEIDFSKFGEVELVPMSRIKQASAKNLHRSWLNVPHVTQFDEADVTELEAFRKLQNVELKAQGAKLTPLAFLVKACVHALKTYPQFNSSLQSDYKNLIQKHFYNIGVAVETPDGLVVPVIKDADKKGVVQLAAETSELAGKARDKKLPMDAMQGATFTISSLGGIGGTKFTPIVNAPEVAILGVSKSKVEPVWNGSEFLPRTILPLSLSYDHRAIDGAEAARFTNYLGKVLTDVRRLLL